MSTLVTAALCTGYTIGCFSGSMVAATMTNRNKFIKLKQCNTAGFTFGVGGSLMLGLPTMFMCHLLTYPTMPKLGVFCGVALLNHLGISFYHNDDTGVL